MKLYRIGKTTVNVERINGVLDCQVPADSGAPDGRAVLRVLFDHTHIDLTGKEAEIFRHWYRHAARCLDPRKDEDGEELVSPEEQVRKACEILRDLIDREYPRDREMLHAVRRLGRIVEQFLTGELQPVRAANFESGFITH